MEREIKEYIVTVQQWIIIGHRTKPEAVDRYFFPRAKTARSAWKAVKDTGIKGEIVSVELASEQRKRELYGEKPESTE